MSPPLSVIELRQYTLHPGRSDELIALFEREFIEPQEALGIGVLGTFRDLDAPDRFVWLRGFADMPARGDALGAFYGGPAWQAHREQANATMVDSDNVLLLRALGGGQGLAAALQPHPPVDAAPVEGGVFTITVCPLRAPPDDALARVFDRCVHASWVGGDGELLACWATEDAPNNFPRLPVREGESVIAWLTRFDDEAAQRRHAALLTRSGCLERPEWRALLSCELTYLRLVPTARSALRRHQPL